MEKDLQLVRDADLHVDETVQTIDEHRSEVEGFVTRLTKAIESDLFEEIDGDICDQICGGAKGVTVISRMAREVSGEVHRLAADCEEVAVTYQIVSITGDSVDVAKLAKEFDDKRAEIERCTKRMNALKDLAIKNSQHCLALFKSLRR